MAFIRDIKIPPETKKYFCIKNFEGGLNNRGSYIRLSNNQSPSLMNIDLSEYGAIQKRKGVKKHITSVLGEKIIHVGEHDEFVESTKTYNKKRVRITPTKIYFNDASINAPNVKDYTTYLGKMLFVDGDKYYVIKEGKKYEVVLSSLTDSKTKYDDTKFTVEYGVSDNESKDPKKGVNRIPPKCKFVLHKDQRTILAGNPEEPNMVYFSDLGNPFYFPANLSVQLPPSSDKITGVTIFMNSIVVFREFDVYVIYGDNVENFRVKKINAHCGTRSPKTIKSVGNFIYYLGSDEQVYSLFSTKSDVDYTLTKHISQTVELRNHPIDANPSDLEDAFAFSYQNKYYLHIKDKILVQYLDLYAWTVWSFENIKATSFGMYDDTFIIGTSDGRVLEFSEQKISISHDGKVYESDVQYNDDGDIIKCWWKSKDIDFDLPSHRKKFKKIFIVAHTYTRFESDVFIKFEVDYQEVNTSATVQNQIAIWGKAKFGDKFRKKNIAESDSINVAKMGRILSITLSNDKLNQPMKVYEINGEYQIKKPI